MKSLKVSILIAMLVGLLISAASVAADVSGGVPAVDAAKPKPTQHSPGGPGNGNPGGHPGGNPGGNPGGSPGLGKQNKPEKQHNGNPNKGPKLQFRGTITAVGAGLLTLQLGNATTVTVSISNTTQIHIPTLGAATAANLLVGMDVKVQAVASPTSGQPPLATRIQVVPGKPEKLARVGTVIAYTPGMSITIESKQGISTTYKLISNTVILPASYSGTISVGMVVTIQAPRSLSFASAVPIAKGIVVHVPENDDINDND